MEKQNLIKITGVLELIKTDSRIISFLPTKVLLELASINAAVTSNQIAITEESVNECLEEIHSKGI